jgi:hypothetical protein
MVLFKQILCPIDFSEFSRHAFGRAVGIARCYDAGIAVPTPPLPQVPLFIGPRGGRRVNRQASGAGRALGSCRSSSRRRHHVSRDLAKSAQRKSSRREPSKDPVVTNAQYPASMSCCSVTERFCGRRQCPC